jgi:GT2 family glycosyltransferase
MGPQGLDSGIMGGETELLRRLRDAGEQCIFVPRTRVRHVIQSHQLEPDWLLRRMFRMGRTKTKLQPDREAVRVLGAPRFLWRQLIKAALRHVIARIRGGRARLETGLELYRLRGELYQYRSARHPGLITRLLQP